LIHFYACLDNMLPTAALSLIAIILLVLVRKDLFPVWAVARGATRL
jgi:hypothetical protein